MTDEERARIKEMIARRQVAYDYIEQERLERLRNTVTKDEIAKFNDIFEQSLKLPPRATSGFVEFYKAMSKLKR